MHKTAYLLLLLTTLFWGGNAVAGKLAVGHVSPMLLTTARWGFALIISASSAGRSLAADWPKVRRNAFYLTALGAVGFSIFNIALYSAVIYTTAINVSIEQAAIPMLIFARQFPALQAARDLGADSGLRPFAGRRRADRRPWRPDQAPYPRREPRRRPDAGRSCRLCRLHRRVARQARHPLAKPDDRPDRGRLRRLAAIPRGRILGRRRHPAGCAGLGRHRLHGRFPVDPGADILHQRRRADRRKPRRPVHKSGADLRHAAVDRPARRGVLTPITPSPWRWCSAAYGWPRRADGGWRPAEARSASPWRDRASGGSRHRSRARNRATAARG